MAGRARQAGLAKLGDAAPPLLAAATFAAGAILLFSGALPASPGRLAWLSELVPPPAIELSHFLASLVGAVLLVVAHGLQRRLDGAWLLASVLVGAGIVLSLAKGADYEEAAILGGVLLALAANRRHFYRRASLLAAPFGRGWVASIAIVLVGSLWLYLFAFRHVEYSADTWWQFALHAEAPRALRATAAGLCVAVLLAAARLLHASPPSLRMGDRADLERARPIIARSAWTYANLALRGDKALLFSDAGDAFLMYGRMHRSWIAMGDPIGPPAAAAELVGRFCDLCDLYDDWPVFFEVRPENVPLYLDLGLTVTKLGEEARVALPAFDLATPQRAKLRQARARVHRAGCRFALVPPSEAAGLMSQVARVSQEWLAAKATREKGFSNASFDLGYLANFPLAIVMRDERVLAFANVWTGAGREELSVDLMRHAPDAPNGTMDFLFAELMLWGRQEGFRWFNFGTAPLAGVEHEADGPLWGRFAGLVYHSGEHFYNFQGLHAYKEKFGPEWSPRYLASPGGVALPAVMVDVVSLMAGGFTGILAK